MNSSEVATRCSESGVQTGDSNGLRLTVELKLLKGLTGIEEAQLLNDLKATRRQQGYWTAGGGTVCPACWATCVSFSYVP